MRKSLAFMLTVAIPIQIKIIIEVDNPLDIVPKLPTAMPI